MEGDARLSINFLPNAVYSPLACIQLTLRTAQAVGLPINRLIFEFTENEEMGSPEHVASIIETYQKVGFSRAIDDFGAGHSGLDMFARFLPTKSNSTWNWSAVSTQIEDGRRLSGESCRCATISTPSSLQRALRR